MLGEADAPAGASYLGTDVGPEILTNPVWYLSSLEQQRFRALPGFIYASASSYRLGSSSADPLFVSEVMLFDDADSAAHAMAAYAEEWESSFGFDNKTPSTVELGEEGLLFSGPAAVQNGEPGFYYFWRVDNLLLNMVAVGPVEGAELDEMETTVRAMALEMDRRAEAGVDDAEHVFRDFNAAIAAGDEERAAGLLAEGGQIFHQEVTEASVDGILGGFSCIAEVLAVEGSGETVVVRLRFTGTRPGAVSECDVIGTEETVVVTARAGRIVSIDEP